MFLLTIIRPLVLRLETANKLLCVVVAAAVDRKINTTC